MTAAPIPTPRPPAPTPCLLAVGRRVTFAPPRELRPVEGAAPVADVVARDRARWADCSRGAHAWVTTPMRVICQFCPVPEDQAPRVLAALRTRHGRL